MVRSVIRFSAEHKFLVLALTAVAVAYGLYTLRHIPVDAGQTGLKRRAARATKQKVSVPAHAGHDQRNDCPGL